MVPHDLSSFCTKGWQSESQGTKQQSMRERPGPHLLEFIQSVNFSVMSDSSRPHGLQATQLLHPWNSLGKNTGVGCHFILQGICPSQGSNLGLLHCRQILYHLSHQGISFKGRCIFSNRAWYSLLQPKIQSDHRAVVNIQFLEMQFHVPLCRVFSICSSMFKLLSSASFRWKT